MFSEELTKILLQVIKSWQVIAVTVVLVLYISLVGYAARAHHKPVSVSRNKPRKKGKSKPGSTPTPSPTASQGSKEPAGDKITEQE